MTTEFDRNDTPQAVYERIRRRRDAALAESTAPAATPAALKIDEVLEADSHGAAAPLAGAVPPSGSAAGDNRSANDDRSAVSERSAGDDRFPRSRTMRLALAHPGLALAIGVPAALLVARSPASRRLLGTAFRLGTQPEVRQLVRLSASAARQFTAPSRVVDSRLVDPLKKPL